MDGYVVVKVFAWIFVALAIGLPIYLYATRPRSKYRRSRIRKVQRMAAGLIALSAVLVTLLMILVLSI